MQDNEITQPFCEIHLPNPEKVRMAKIFSLNMNNLDVFVAAVDPVYKIFLQCIEDLNRTFNAVFENLIRVEFVLQIKEEITEK